MTPAEEAAARVAALRADKSAVGNTDPITAAPMSHDDVVEATALMRAMADKDAQIATQQEQMAAMQQQLADLKAKAPAAAPVEGKGELKAYYSTIPMCNTHVMRGPGICDTVQFVAGMLETDDLQVQAHLNAVCDRPGTGITSVPQTAISQEEARMRADVRESAVIARDKMIAAGEKTV